MNSESSGHEKLERMLKDGRSELHNLSLKCLRDITDNFCDERLLGEGGFGTVYKGVLQNGETIAVKKLNSSIPGVKDKQFENEANHLMRLEHPNVVRIVGWCYETENIYVEYNGKNIWAEKRERLLCLEYMPKGNLCGYLSDASSGLDWDTRYNIIEGICYGLRYLHEKWKPNAPIVHMDLKPANILLDNNMVPKIADFGLSRLFSEEKAWTYTISRHGTLGYMSPEYINKGLISTKLDIFSLGVIIIEIVTGRRDYPDDTGIPSEEFIKMVLHNWSQRKWLFGVSHHKQIRRCIRIGLDCVKTDPSKRPTISQIIKELLHSPAAASNTSGLLLPPDHMDRLFSPRCVWVNGPLIVGAGPSGLTVAACLVAQGVPNIILERADCIASQWQKRTYNPLLLHLPKQFHGLPMMPLPDLYPKVPKYPTRRQFIDYLQCYASKFDIKPRFSNTVLSARYDEMSGLWRVTSTSNYGVDTEYIGRWLVVATGENAEVVIPDIPGLDRFDGPVTHVRDYKYGEAYAGKRVLVVGCGSSGVEVSLDLFDHGARPAMVVRDAVHVLPREVLGQSTLELARLLMRWLPLWIVDKIMVLLAWLVLGNLAKLGLRRPATGPFELMFKHGSTPLRRPATGPFEPMLKHGRTPVFDCGAVARIRARDIAVVPAVIRFRKGGQVEFADGRKLNFDAVILATGYRSNVPQLLQGNDFFNKDGYPKTAFPHGWKGQPGLYAVGFSRRGICGASADAVRIARDLGTDRRRLLI